MAQIQAAAQSPNNGELDTLHINLWGLPGTNKREVAGQLYGRLSLLGVSTALVADYSRELGWAGVLARKNDDGDLEEFDQFIICAEQFRREEILHGRVSVAVSESPALAGVLYAQEDDEDLLRGVLRRRTSGWRNLDILLERDIPETYESMGRIQSREEALAMRPRLMTLIEKERPRFIKMATDTAADAIMEIVTRELGLPVRSAA